MNFNNNPFANQAMGGGGWQNAQGQNAGLN